MSEGGGGSDEPQESDTSEPVFLGGGCVPEPAQTASRPVLSIRRRNKIHALTPPCSERIV